MLSDSEVIILKAVRDVKVYYSLFPNSSIRAELHGFVTRVNARGGIVFFRITDGTDSIQLIADRRHFNDDGWQQIRSIKQSSRISCSSPVGLSNRGEVSVLLREPPLQMPELRADPFPEWESDPMNVGTQIFLARLRARASAFFEFNDFLGIEPRLISASWEEGGLQPLRVGYEGFGVPMYLAPSPHSQLLKALIVTGTPKIFCVSRCFTSTYRDDIVGTESVILCAKELRASLDRMRDLASDAVRNILGDISTMPEEAHFLSEEWVTTHHEWPPGPNIRRVSRPEVQTFSNFTSQDSVLERRKINIFRICWPPSMVLAEGISELLDGGIHLGSLTIHLERIVPLLQDINSRRLQHLNPVRNR